MHPRVVHSLYWVVIQAIETSVKPKFKNKRVRKENACADIFGQLQCICTWAIHTAIQVPTLPLTTLYSYPPHHPHALYSESHSSPSLIQPVHLLASLRESLENGWRKRKSVDVSHHLPLNKLLDNLLILHNWIFKHVKCSTWVITVFIFICLGWNYCFIFTISEFPPLCYKIICT